MQNPGAFGAESDPTRVKGGIARTTGSQECRAAKHRSCSEATEEVESFQNEDEGSEMNENASDRTKSIEWDRVARFYDLYAQATFDIPFFVQEASTCPGDVLELMAGTGRVSLPLVKAGVHLTCVDSAPEMLAVLRQKLAQEHLSAQVHEMDVRDLAFNKQFDLILIPFHSFGELTSPDDQKRVLARLHEHLSEKGRFICTLHNSSHRLRSVDGQFRLVGSYPGVEPQTTLLFWSVSNAEPASNIVHAWQFYELYDQQGMLREKSLLEIRFAQLQRAEFETLAEACGFQVLSFYGDYAYAPFQEETSPYMIWVLGKQSG
jgi:SAM-dependent methyltransferase